MLLVVENENVSTMYWIIAVVLALAFFIFLYVVTDHTPTFEVQGKHVVITGGKENGHQVRR